LLNIDGNIHDEILLVVSGLNKNQENEQNVSGNIQQETYLEISKYTEINRSAERFH
jgi:hypothetical protein